MCVHIFKLCFINVLIFSLAFGMLSCGSAKVEPVPEPAVEEAPAVEEPKPVAPAPAPVAPKPKPAQKTKEEMEYERSVGTTAVSVDTFTQDKNAILRIINELSAVMKNKDYKLWRTYLDQESVEYWSRPTNLRKAQNRLPRKGLRLNSLEDYFNYVFVPARAKSEVNEIRYVSDTYVKVVQAKGERETQDVIYYYFNKINGKWMLHLPPLE